MKAAELGLVRYDFNGAVDVNDGIDVIVNLDGRLKLSQSAGLSKTFHDSDSLRANDRWIAYVVGAFQNRTNGDRDADNEPTAFGVTVGTDPATGYHGHQCTIYSQTFYEMWSQSSTPQAVASVQKTEAYTVVHEIGHAFGLVHNGANNKDSIMYGGAYAFYSDTNWQNVERQWSQGDRQNLRSATKSPGR